MPSCFVLIPFHEPFTGYYQKIIVPAINDNGLVPQRGDSLFRPGPRMDDVWRMIHESEALVAVLTGQNANVFYELGLAHAVGKPVVLISETLKDVPFDLQSLRVIVYDKDNSDWGEELRRKLHTALEQTRTDPRGAIPSMFRRPVIEATERSAMFSADHDAPDFGHRARILYARLVEGEYLPDLIIAVSRGGLGVAYHLSKGIPQSVVPVISLWPDTSLVDPFDNPFNQIAFGIEDITDASLARLLIVDDMSISGRTLRYAKAYLARRLNSTAVEIRTAAISLLRGISSRPPQDPDFHVEELVGAVRDQAGEIEKGPWRP